MSFLKLVVPVVALASSAYAQRECSTSATLTVTNAADASGLASCQTYSGSIAIATGATEISIPVTRITGNLITVPNGDLTSLAAPSLRQVDGRLTVQAQPNIATLSMPSLIEVEQFTLQSLGPNLLSLDFGTPGLQQVSTLSVSDTFLQSFNGINLKTAEGILVATNQLLTDLTMQISNVTGTFEVRGNSMQASGGLTVSVPNLAEAGSVLINNVQSVDLSALGNVTTVVNLNENIFTELAFPNLTQIGPNGGGFNIINNPQLTNLSAPLLAKVQGGVDVVNNTKLGGTYSFPSLRLVGSGAFSGPFTNVELPELVRMQGTLKLRSTRNIQAVCDRIEQEGNVAGGVECSSAQPTQSSSGSQSTSTGSGNAAGHYAASPETVLSVFGGLAALFGLFV